MPTNQQRMNNQVLEVFPEQYNLIIEKKITMTSAHSYSRIIIPGVPQNVDVNFPSKMPSLHIPKLENKMNLSSSILQHFIDRIS